MNEDDPGVIGGEASRGGQQRWGPRMILPWHLILQYFFHTPLKRFLCSISYTPSQRFVFASIIISEIALRHIANIFVDIG